MNRITKCAGFLSFGLIAGMIIPNPMDTNNFDNLNKFSDKTIDKVAYTNYLKVNNTDTQSNQFMYLSDVTYANGSGAGYGKITYDKTINDQSLSLRINGSQVVFKKGVFAHAASTLIYDVSNLEYDYFTTYYGVSAYQGGAGSVKFYIYTSTDGTNWNLETSEEPHILTASSNAEFVKINIKGKKYIKLYADSCGGNGNDHALYGDAKFIKEGYSDDVTMSVEEYDKLIKNKYSKNEFDTELEALILQRYLVSNIGNYQLKQFLEESKDNEEVLNWLFNDINVLRYYVYGGKPDGSYLYSLQVLSKLYYTYKQDLSNNNLTDLGVKYSDLYERMMVSLSLTHTSRVGLWTQNNAINGSDPVNRYKIYKELHLEGKLENNIYEKLSIEEMRWVMNNQIDDESIKWLNWYSREIKKSTNPYAYINYTFGYNYSRPQYYSEENFAKWDEKYHLSEFGITYGKSAKLWIVFEEGSVCGGISKTGSNLLAARGIPSAVIGQPGHAAYLGYGKDNQGRGQWGLYNDVSGWTQSEKSERMLNAWGSNSWDSYYQVSYTLMSQAALNDINSYNKAKEYVILADSYTDLATKEAIFNKAIEVQPINMDAWYGLITTYLANSNKTEADYYNLALRLTDSMKYYPLPMVDLLKLFESKYTSGEYQMKATLLKTRVLTEGTTATEEQVHQSGITRTMAKYLLGIYEDSKIATFSFDGEKAGKISLAERYTMTGVRWDYSLDGGNSWTPTSEKEVQLTKDELASITTENDIKVHIVGVAYTEDNIYTIDILKANLPANLYANDLENRLIGINDTMEWRLQGTENWTSYKTENPRFTGNVIVEHRVGATGVYLPSDIITTEFTEDNQTSFKKYIPIEHLSLHEFSSEASSNNGHASHALDGNLNTLWHSNYGGGDTNKYIVIKLDEPRYISALQYVPRQSGSNGRIKDGKMYLSMDGVNWTEASSFTWDNSSYTKETVLSESQIAQYVKLQAITNYGDGRHFISAAMINLFEDFDGERPRADLEYSTEESTTQAVTVRLVNPSTAITITNNGGKDYYIFTENGSFTFEFIDSKGRKNSKTATVDWIYDYQFSFDGKNPGTILLSNKYNCDGFLWEYSIDGGSTYKQQSTLSYKLTEDEINAMTADNDLKIRFIKANNAPSDIITIDILPPVEMTNLYANDLENKVIGATDDMEWRIVGTENWTSYATDKPNLSGNYSIEIRPAAKGTKLRGETQTFNFTKDVEDIHNTYVSVDHLKVIDYSSQNVRPDRGELEHATNAIDGNKNTAWHTDRTSTTDERYIVLELDNPRFLTQVDVIGRENYEWGVIKQGVVYVSLDGNNWTQVASVNDPKFTTKDEIKQHNEKTFKFDQPVYAKYVKIESKESHDYIAGDLNGKPCDFFLNIAMVNIYEDSTLKEEEVLVYIDYSVKDITNQNVVARVYSPNSTLTITNNNGSDTYTFTENGEFTFEYVDAKGNAGKITAVVDKIDKEAPWAELIFSESTLTKNDVTVSIIFNEEVIIENTDLSLLKDPSGNPMLLFKNNGTINLIVKDLVGNKATIPVTVSWIDKEAPVPTVVYSTNTNTKDNVVVTVNFNEKTILDNPGFDVIKNNEYSYSFVVTNNMKTEISFEDLAGNEGKHTIEVNWIDREAPTATVEYSTMDKTTSPVTATLKANEDITILNNGGRNTYVFKENGEFTFEFVDKAGNKGTQTVSVDWIEKEPLKVELSYSPVMATGGNVIVKLNANKDIKILNNDGKDTYVFTENGVFTFQYEDEDGQVGTIEAKVDWISKTLPYANVTYSTTELTKEDVVVTLDIIGKDLTITNNNGLNTYTFTENGEFTFEYVDSQGNKGTTGVVVDWIDKEAPIVEFEYSTTDFTNQDVTVTLIANEEITILNNPSNTYTFTQNGEFTFEYVDKVGNVGSATAKVSWINKQAPVINVSYSTTNKTYNNVIASISLSDGITITNNEGSNIYVFKDNGEFTFEYVDKYGNKGYAVAKVDWILTDKLNVEVVYDFTSLTNKDVTATIKANANITILNNDGIASYVFKDNGKFTFFYEDETGATGSITAVVDWIDKVAPTATVEFDIKDLTNKDVIATLVNPSENITIIDVPDGRYVFTENGEYTFIFRDEAGNEGQAVAKVDWIDKIAPEVTFSYSETNPTMGPVIVNIDCLEDITILNNGGKKAYIFTENGEFTFEYVDSLGNKATATAKVDWIKSEVKQVEIEYSITNETMGPVIVTLKNAENITVLNNGGKKAYIFTENGTFTFEYLDEFGNKCVVTAKVDWIKDQNNNGPVDVNVPDDNMSDVVDNDKDIDKDVDKDNDKNNDKDDNDDKNHDNTVTDDNEKASNKDIVTKEEQEKGNKTGIVLLVLAGVALISRLIYLIFKKDEEEK